MSLDITKISDNEAIVDAINFANDLPDRETAYEKKQKKTDEETATRITQNIAERESQLKIMWWREYGIM